MKWETYNETRLLEAQKSERPVIMDFYADWCIPCLEMERITFTDDEVIQSTENMVKLKVDLTNFESQESEEVRSNFNVAGVPTIIFLDPHGNEITDARIVGFAGPDTFLRQVEKVNN